MADDNAPGAGAPLPPKLNLKKDLAAPKPAAPVSPSPQPVPAPATPTPAAQPAPALTAQPTAKTVAPASGSSGTTMHIDVPEAKPADGLSPKTVKIKRPATLGSAAPAAAKPAQLGTKPAALGAKPAALGAKPVALGAKPAAVAADGAAKKDTSKIPLEAASATGGSDGGSAPKTIRIKPTAAPSTIKIGQPSGAAPAAGPGALTEKSKTSRISLEAALGAGDAAAPSGDGPKTIRLKRPSEAATIKLSQKPSLSKVPTASAAMDKTARLDDADAADGGESATQRKTIRVKRPTKTAGVKPTIAVKRKPGAAAAAGGGDKEGAAKAVAKAEVAAAPAPRHDEPGVVWSVFTIMAILVVGTVIWMFMAQGVGPNSCMTQYSYAPLWKNMPWPGKLRRERNFVRRDLAKLEPGMAPPAEGGGDVFGGEDFGGEEGFGDEFSDEAPAEGAGGDAAPADGGGESLDDLAL